MIANNDDTHTTIVVHANLTEQKHDLQESRQGLPPGAIVKTVKNEDM